MVVNRTTTPRDQTPKGRAAVALREDGAETVLTYAAKSEIGDKIASLGGRLIQATSRKLADQFFGTFAAELSVPAVEAAADAGS